MFLCSNKEITSTNKDIPHLSTEFRIQTYKSVFKHGILYFLVKIQNFVRIWNFVFEHRISLLKHEIPYSNLEFHSVFKPGIPYSDTEFHINMKICIKNRVFHAVKIGKKTGIT